MTREPGPTGPDEEAKSAATADLRPSAPALDLSRLDAIQRWARYGAIAATLLCVGAFVFFSYRLSLIVQELTAKRTDLAKANEDLVTARGTLKATNDEVDRKRQEADSLQGQIEFYRKTLQACGGEGPQQAVEATAAQAAAQAGGNWSQIPARIYIQIGAESQRARADELARLLQASGFIVPEIENVGGMDKVPRRSQLRRYAGRWSPDDVHNILELFGGRGVNLELPDPRSETSVRPRHYEIWFGQDF